jgi:hypothetical protein
LTYEPIIKLFLGKQFRENWTSKNVIHKIRITCETGISDEIICWGLR